MDEQIMQAQLQESELNSGIQEVENRKRKLHQDYQKSRDTFENVKVRKDCCHFFVLAFLLAFLIPCCNINDQLIESVDGAGVPLLQF